MSQRLYIHNINISKSVIYICVYRDIVASVCVQPSV